MKQWRGLAATGTAWEQISYENARFSKGGIEAGTDHVDDGTTGRVSFFPMTRH